jgi:hypothetical protein
MRRTLAALLLLLSAGYIGINFVGLPPMLVAENIILASLYAIFAVLILRRPGRGVYAALLLVAAFNAGRVSRTIWSPTQGFGVLAVEHIPLFAYLLLVAVLTAVATVRE